MIRKNVWEKIPFDENVTNIEDRVWAQKVLSQGYNIVYEPEASVYHHHGIHQDGNVERCANVINILKSIHDDYAAKSIDLEKMNIVAIVPVKGNIGFLGDKPLLEYTVESALESRFIKKVIVSTDNAELAAIAKKIGAEAPFMRDKALSEERVDLGQVLKYSLDRIESLGILPDLVVSLEITFPFRPKGLLDEMILQLSNNGLDSVIAARRENRSLWKKGGSTVVQLDEDITPRQYKEPSFIGLKGVGCVTHPEFLRQGSILGKKIGIYEVNNPYSHLEVRSEDDFTMANFLINGWRKK